MGLFQPATRRKLKGRIALDGPSGSGKTFTALRFATALGDKDGKIAVIDTEHRAASKYQGLAPDGQAWQFDVCELSHYSPNAYRQAIQEAGRNGYDVLVIDSLSHAWDGVGGALDLVDQKGGNSFTAWKDVTPLHRAMIEAILAAPCHVIATMRSKMEYVLEEETNKQGRTISVPRKVGMAPIQRQGTEYEFDLVADLSQDHRLVVSKTRCPALDGLSAVKPDAAFLRPFVAWLDEGVAGVAPAAAEPAPPTEGRPDGFVERDNEPCSQSQVAEIKRLAAATNMPVDLLKDVLGEYRAKRLADLTVKQASLLIGELRNQQTLQEHHDHF